MPQPRKSIKTARWAALAADISCPECGEGFVDDAKGSYMHTTDSIIQGLGSGDGRGTITCDSCGAKCRMPQIRWIG